MASTATTTRVSGKKADATLTYVDQLRVLQRLRDTYHQELSENIDLIHHLADARMEREQAETMLQQLQGQCAMWDDAFGDLQRSCMRLQSLVHLSTESLSSFSQELQSTSGRFKLLLLSGIHEADGSDIVIPSLPAVGSMTPRVKDKVAEATFPSPDSPKASANNGIMDERFKLLAASKSNSKKDDIRKLNKAPLFSKPRRKAALNIPSLAEPALNRKLRQGDPHTSG